MPACPPRAAAVIGLVALALACGPAGLAHAQEEPPVDVLFGFFTFRSFFGLKNVAGLESEIVTKAATNFLNSKKDYPGRRVNLIAFGRDTSGSNAPGEAFSERCPRAVSDMLAAGALATIGPATSSCSRYAADPVNAMGLPFVSQAASADVLSDKAAYPTFFRVISPDAFQGEILASIADKCSWANVGIIHTTNAIGIGLKDAFVRSYSQTPQAIVDFDQATNFQDLIPKLRQLKAGGSSVNIVFANRDDALAVLRAADSEAVQMSGPDWQWLGSDGLATQSQIDPALAQSFQNHSRALIGARPLSGFGEIFRNFTAFEEPNQFRQYTFDTAVPTYAARILDSIRAIQLAAARAGNWSSPAEGRRKIVEQLRTFNRTNPYRGASQADVFFNEKQDGPAAYDIAILSSGQFLPLASATPDSIALVNSSLDPSHWIFNSGNCPSSAQPVVPTTTTLPPRIIESTRSASGDLPTYQIILIVLFCFAGLLCCLFGFVGVRRGWRARRPYDFAQEVAAGLNNKPTEIRRSRLQLIETIGRGHYGEVVKATLLGTSISQLCAVKTVIGSNELADQALLAEAATLAEYAVGCKHVIQLIGVVTLKSPYWLVMEYCEHGSLRDFLQTQMQSGREYQLKGKISLMADVAEGMAYLASRGGVHRDLAARNILLSSDYTIRIADFGMYKDGEYYIQGFREIPIKWTAPEILKRGKYTCKSDVWAFGILLVEAITNGEEPYPTMSADAVRVAVTESQFRHPKIAGCPASVYRIMRACWAEEPSERWAFQRIQQKLTKLLKTSAKLDAALVSVLDRDDDNDNSEEDVSPIAQEGIDEQRDDSCIGSYLGVSGISVEDAASLPACRPRLETMI